MHHQLIPVVFQTGILATRFSLNNYAADIEFRPLTI